MVEDIQAAFVVTGGQGTKRIHALHSVQAATPKPLEYEPTPQGVHCEAPLLDW